ncbi:flagellin [Xanthobacter sp. V0B-10]|uniref:flagellin N-terminal helical domain-containing protein n=1 Tax=Xanthobacter albus TaxID=3119929 RepID=UPI00372B4093
MTSMLTNNSAMVALQTLRSINNDLETTNNRVSTGKKINDASDSASYWSIATTLTSDNNTLKGVTDAMALDSNAVTTASKGLTQVKDDLDTIKKALASALSANADRGALQKDIAAALTNIKTAATSSISGSAGDNWLSVDSSNTTSFTEDKALLASFSRSGDTVSVSTTTIDTGEFRLYDANTAGGGSTSTVTTKINNIISNSSVAANTASGVNAATVALDTGSSARGFMDTKYTVTYTQVGGTAATTTAAASLSEIDISALTDNDIDLISSYMKIVDSTRAAVVSGAATLGTNASRLQSQQNFANSLIDLNKSSIGTLVDADMEEESTRLKALQTQQSLAIQSLSIANSSSSNVLQLFR